MKGLLKHLSSKWACPAGKTLVLLPPSEAARQGLDPGAYWGTAQHGTTLASPRYL